MRNQQQCPEKLLYNSFSVILFHTFTTSNFRKEFLFDLSKQGGISILRNSSKSIDSQIFTHKEKIINRYNLPGFSVNITLGAKRKNSEGKTIIPTISGKVQVQAAIFFNATIQISYRFVVDKSVRKSNFCRTNTALNSDEIIALASLLQTAEHWDYNKYSRQQEICKIANIRISDVHIDKDHNYVKESTGETNLSLSDLADRYRAWFDATPSNEFIGRNYHYSLIDIWEDFQHEGNTINFDKMSEAEIIEHIEVAHRPELVGIMSLYPAEWKYRTELSFEDICGKNIAIDTDDLVLVNQNVCLIFGTYGKRGEESPTDWHNHLKIRSLYHTSWPEYVALLELNIARKVTTNFVHNTYIHNSTLTITDKHNYIEQIESNTHLSVSLANMLFELEATQYLRFMAHKHMYRLTYENMSTHKDEIRLRDTMKLIDNAITRANNIIEAKQSETTKNILFFISVASLFSVLLTNDNVPVLSLLSQSLGTTIAIILEVVTMTGILFGLYIFFKIKFTKPSK